MICGHCNNEKGHDNPTGICGRCGRFGRSPQEQLKSDILSAIAESLDENISAWAFLDGCNEPDACIEGKDDFMSAISEKIHSLIK